MKIHKTRLLEILQIATPAYLFVFAYLFFNYHTKAAVFIPPEKTIRSLVLLWLLLIPALFIVHSIVKEKKWSSIYLYAFALIFYTSEAFFNAFLSILLLVLFTVTAGYYILRKKMIPITNLIFVITAIPIGFFLFTLFRVAPFYFQPDWKLYIAALPDKNTIVSIPAQPEETLPDIYYIVVDGYGRADILQEYYNYDNSPFIDKLNSKGFIVPTGISSNYAKTVSSVTSTLNMNYTDAFIKGVDDSLFWWLAKPYIQESLTQNSLEALGYESVSIATDWDITNNTAADLHLKPQWIHLDEYEGKLIETSRLSIVNPLIEQMAFYPTHTSHRNLILFSFEQIKKVAKRPGPQFVFAHIVSPHPPFVFDRDGNHVTPNYGFTFNDANNFPGTTEQYRTGYINQIEHLNNMLEEMIDVILAESETPPIIIIQADHGPGMLTDFSALDNTCAKERFSIFAAYYLPEASPDTIPNDITPVNLFRIIFNEYFHTDLDILDNKHYYFKDTVYVYRTEDITEKIKQYNRGASCTQP
jgi:hypothetical protein